MANLPRFAAGAVRQHLEQLLKLADIEINGSRPWDLQLRDSRLYQRVLRRGSLGLGEAYMDGWWDCPALDEFVARLFRAGIDRYSHSGIPALYRQLRSRLLNLQNRWRAWRVGQQHYDLDRQLFAYMLDPGMTYSCGYWARAQTLAEAQQHKLELLCRKLNLQPGQRILDVGCGWGSFAEHAAHHYGVAVVGLTVSAEQADFARRRCQQLPVEIRLQDYRALDGEYDHIVSVGMFEHVGYKNYRRYMHILQRCLRPGGLFLLHTIGGNTTVTATDPWIDKYIFPNGMLPSIAQIGRAIESLFVMEDWHNFGVDYDRTLLAWHQNFSQHLPELNRRYGERFCRMWAFYLLASAGAFRARSNQVWQVVLSKTGLPGGYLAIR